VLGIKALATTFLFLITLIVVLYQATVYAFEVTATITLERHAGYYGAT